MSFRTPPFTSALVSLSFVLPRSELNSRLRKQGGRLFFWTRKHVQRLFACTLVSLPTETKVQSGTSQSKSGTSINFSNCGDSGRRGRRSDSGGLGRATGIAMATCVRPSLSLSRARALSLFVSVSVSVSFSLSLSFCLSVCLSVSLSLSVSVSMSLSLSLYLSLALFPSLSIALSLFLSLSLYRSLSHTRLSGRGTFSPVLVFSTLINLNVLFLPASNGRFHSHIKNLPVVGSILMEVSFHFRKSFGGFF